MLVRDTPENEAAVNGAAGRPETISTFRTEGEKRFPFELLYASYDTFTSIPVAFSAPRRALGRATALDT